MAKGVAHAGKGKSLSSGEACENERRGWNEDSYRRKNEKEWNNYDWSRHHLNFEIKDGKIIPLGSQAVSLYDRYLNVLKDIGFKEYKAGATNQQHTYIELIFSGSTDKMQKIAFGNQKVDFERAADTALPHFTFREEMLVRPEPYRTAPLDVQDRRMGSRRI